MQDLRNALAKQVCVEGFREQGARTGGKGLIRCLRRRNFARNEHDGDVAQRRVGPQNPAERVAVQPRHHDVGDDQVDVALPQPLEGLISVGGFEYVRGLRSQRTEAPSDIGAQLGFIVHNQDLNGDGLRMGWDEFAGHGRSMMSDGADLAGRLPATSPTRCVRC